MTQSRGRAARPPAATRHRTVVAAGTLVIAFTAAGTLAGGTWTGRPTPAGASAPAHTVVDRLAWLAGCWAGTLSNGALYEEMWLPPRAGQMVGAARTTNDGRTLSFEFVRIAAADGALVYYAQPAGRPPTEFRATQVAHNAVTFENPAHDFPQRIRYRFAAPDSLTARIEGERNGQARGFDFPLRRTACAATGG